MQKTKAKRKLEALDFTGKDAAVALVSSEQGGPANGVPTLLIKAANFSDETLEKASQVTVTMEITEFLQRMFGMWSADAEILARALGYTTAEMDSEAEDKAAGEPETYQDYITSKVQSIEVMKQLHEADETVSVLSELTEDAYLALIQDQETIEKAFAVIDKQKNKDSDSEKPKRKVKSVKAEEDTPAKGIAVDSANTEGKGSQSSVNKSTKKDKKTMTKEVEVIETEVEYIAKSQFDEVQKALAAQEINLQKALEELTVLKKEKQEAIAKARKAELTAVAGNHADTFMKAVGEVDAEVFAEVVKALGEMQKAVEQSDLFKEVGVSSDETEVSTMTDFQKALTTRLTQKQK